MTDITEEWRPVVGFERRYEVSDLGRVRSLDRRVPVNRNGKTHTKFYPSREISQIPHPHDPYMRVWLSRDGKVKPFTVHAIVALTFYGPRPEGKEVCHRDGNGRNNAASNLRYATRAYNREDSRRHGTLAVGETIVQSKLTEGQVRTIRALALGPAEIAKRYSVSLRQARRVANRELWKHV